jgi:hypothetical protein
MTATSDSHLVTRFIAPPNLACCEKIGVLRVEYKQIIQVAQSEFQVSAGHSNYTIAKKLTGVLPDVSALS